MKPAYLLRALALALPVALSLAQNETPRDDDARIFEPYAFDLGTGVGDAALDALADQHYSTSRTSTFIPGSPFVAPAVTVPGMRAAMQAGSAVFVTDSHGSTSGFAVETYEYTSAGLAARDVALTALVNAGYTGLYASEVLGEGYHISVDPTFLTANFTDEDSIVFHSVCSGGAYSNAWGARVVLDYSTGICPTTGITDAELFFRRLNGEQGQESRSCSAARPPSMSLTGAGNTTLAPSISEFEPCCWGDTTGFVEFDTLMDVSVAPNTILSSTTATVFNVVWANPRRIEFDVSWPIVGVQATFNVDAALAHSGNEPALQLDGKACTGAQNAIGPNQDDYCRRVDNSQSALVYCNAKVNSLGCTPKISSTGNPSLIDPDPFLVCCRDVVNQRFGLLFFGVNGPRNAAFHGGTMCVDSPLFRTPTRSSGGHDFVLDCSGVFEIDFKEHALFHPQHSIFLTIGTTVNCEWWYRDPPASWTDGLSDALQFDL